MSHQNAVIRFVFDDHAISLTGLEFTQSWTWRRMRLFFPLMKAIEAGNDVLHVRVCHNSLVRVTTSPAFTQSIIHLLPSLSLYYLTFYSIKLCHYFVSYKCDGSWRFYQKSLISSHYSFGYPYKIRCWNKYNDCINLKLYISYKLIQVYFDP